jgi:hypothetical protein
MNGGKRQIIVLRIKHTLGRDRHIDGAALASISLIACGMVSG